MRAVRQIGGKTRRGIRKRWIAVPLVMAVLFDYLVIDDCYDDGGVWRWSEFSCKGRR